MIKPTKKRLTRLAIVAAFCSIPIIFRIWVEQKHSESQKLKVLDNLGQFYFEDVKGNAFTQVDLHNTVNFVIVSQCQGSCTLIQSALFGVDKWVQSNFTYSGQSNPLHTTSILSASKEILSRTPDRWRRIQINGDTDQSEIQKFIPKPLTDEFSQSESFIVLITGKLEIVKIMDLKDFDAERISSVLSRLSFNTYLDQYLSERTFMGPKRKISKF